MQYHKENIKDEGDFFCQQKNFRVMKLTSLHADKNKGLKQIDTMILMEEVRHSQKFSVFLQYLQKEVRDEVDFCMQVNVKVS